MTAETDSLLTNTIRITDEYPVFSTSAQKRRISLSDAHVIMGPVRQEFDRRRDDRGRLICANLKSLAI